jgi:hypothetical protein
VYFDVRNTLVKLFFQKNLSKHYFWQLFFTKLGIIRKSLKIMFSSIWKNNLTVPYTKIHICKNFYRHESGAGGQTYDSPFGPTLLNLLDRAGYQIWILDPAFFYSWGWNGLDLICMILLVVFYKLLWSEIFCVL